jgi:hypothetical protein
MARVAVEVAEPEADRTDADEATSGPEEAPKRRRADVEVEREITKRQIVQSITTVVVVILYMVFTLLRERDAGVVVVDPDDEGADDWEG